MAKKRSKADNDLINYVLVMSAFAEGLQPKLKNTFHRLLDMMLETDGLLTPDRAKEMGKALKQEKKAEWFH